MKITIDLDNEDHILYLQEVAEENSMIIEKYASNIIKGWLENQLKGKYINYIQNKDTIALKKELGSYKDIQTKIKDRS